MRSGRRAEVDPDSGGDGNQRKTRIVQYKSFTNSIDTWTVDQLGCSSAVQSTQTPDFGALSKDRLLCTSRTCIIMILGP